MKKRIFSVLAAAVLLIGTLFTDGGTPESKDLVNTRITQTCSQYDQMVSVRADDSEDMAIIFLSLNAGSGCLGSACAGSACLGSACAGSVCTGSGCGSSTCGGSACVGSTCGGSACVGSICGGSVCVGSICKGKCR